MIVDDVDTHRSLFTATLQAGGYSVLAARSREEGRTLAESHRPAIALIDIVLPDGDGIELIRQIRDHDPAVKPIAVTAFASVDRAVAAMRGGAVDFLVKPVEPDQLLSTVANALSGHGVSETAAPPARPTIHGFDGHASASRIIRDICATLSSVAGSAAPVFITGESGTGKAKSAGAIHAQSGFRDGPFVTFDCSTAAPDTIETELMGAIGGQGGQDGVGAVERANGGTLLLDEICALSPPMQARLLHLIQSGTVTPVGAVTGRPVDFRLICTSTVNPREMVEAKQFRPDLFYRLNVLPIHLPPLRERGLDVIEIAEIELDRLCAQEGRQFRTLSAEVKAAFLDYRWPGNLRELMNVLWNIVLLHDGPVVELPDLPLYLRDNMSGGAVPASAVTERDQDPFAGRTLAAIERAAIEAAIDRAKGSIPTAACALGVSPSTLYRKLESWGQPVRSSRNPHR
ncbi:sigma-54-dependent transcriptional regulator [Celeribacter indicus]|uniref:Two component, sigma-54 specific, transcriptional regulator n=1 Tax=Celeribacter indicus TaxID=1208324 RepID=A0A0B5DWU5_9RHOB|nr:sigma-54 dependent transcriptional regulator [Celeribacter indicus]AJE45595.1 two component, sigma-54 specific, transcriptional regulator [Celeribacter indicus]